MASTEPAGPGEQTDSTAPRLVVVLARVGGESHVCRVDAPDRVLRTWAPLNNASEELRQVDLPAGAAERLERQLGAFTARAAHTVLASGPRGQGYSPAAPGEPVAAIGAGGPVPAGAPWPSGAYL